MAVATTNPVVDANGPRSSFLIARVVGSMR